MDIPNGGTVFGDRKCTTICVEVYLTPAQYNETINDLLGKGEFDKKKHEIRHEKGSTRVTDVVVGTSGMLSFQWKD